MGMVSPRLPSAFLSDPPRHCTRYSLPRGRAGWLESVGRDIAWAETHEGVIERLRDERKATTGDGTIYGMYGPTLLKLLLLRGGAEREESERHRLPCTVLTDTSRAHAFVASVSFERKIPLRRRRREVGLKIEEGKNSGRRPHSYSYPSLPSSSHHINRSLVTVR